MMKMTKKKKESSARAERIARNVKHTSDEDIDYSDIPASTDEELKKARRVGRPSTGNAKILIAFRIAPRLLATVRKIAAKQDKPYQTLIHEWLEAVAKKQYF